MAYAVDIYIIMALPLHRAVRYNQTTTVQYILANHTNLNERDAHGDTPLHIAVNTNNVNMVQLLLAHPNTNKHATNNMGANPLHHAAWNGNRDIVKLLINDANYINQQMTNGWTPLHQATINSHITTMRYLLRKGANPNIPDIDGHTPIFTAIIFPSNNDITTRQLINMLKIYGANLSHRDKRGRTLLHFAVERNSITLIRYLLRNGIDPNITDNQRWTPLHKVAVKTNIDIDIAKLLLINGANLRIPTTRGSTPLALAKMYSTKHMVRLLRSYMTNNTPSIIYDIKTNDNNECIICMDRKKDTIFIPCGHHCSCMICAKIIVNDYINTTCPICRSSIDKVATNYST